jgi:hypothetical protein
MDPGMGVDPLHLSDGSRELDGLHRIEFGREGMVRPRWRRSQQQTHAGKGEE